MPYQIHLPIAESATLRFNALAAARKQRGLPVYNLSAGEPIIAPHPIIARAAIASIRQGRTLYAPAAGIPELRAAVSDWFGRQFKASYPSENIVITAGGKFGIFALGELLLKPGDEIIIPAPYWTSYPEIAKLFGAIPKIISPEEKNGWKVTADQIREAITHNTKILIINNGGNPTGTLYSEAELKEICEAAIAYGLLIISDEVYSGLAYEKKFVSAGQFANFSENVVLVQSASKHFAMTGWRVGAVAGPTDIIRAVTTLQSQSTSGAASVNQYAALAAFEHAEEINLAVKTELRSRRDVFVANLNSLFKAGFPAPEAGLYCLVPLALLGAKTAADEAWCLATLEKSGVALVPGSAFGAPGYARASFGATHEEIITGLTTLKAYLNSTTDKFKQATARA